MYSSLMQVVQVSIVLGVAFIPLWSQSDAAVNGWRQGQLEQEYV